jgi:hypothetical protein
MRPIHGLAAILLLGIGCPDTGSAGDDDLTPGDDDTAGDDDFCDDDNCPPQDDDDDFVEPPPPGLVFVSDGDGQERFAVFQPAVHDPLLEVDLNHIDYDRCGFDPPGGELVCATWELTHRTGADSRDRLLINYQPATFYESSHERGDPVIGSVLLASDPELEWAIDRLDFTQLDDDPSPNPCVADPHDPCEPHPDAPGPNRGACRLNSPHGTYLLSEDEASARVLTTDTFGNRVLELTLDKASDCAVVDAVYGPGNLPEWGIYFSPNDVYGYEEDGTLHVLVTFRNSTGGTEEQGEYDHGKLLHIVHEPDQAPQVLWVFPPVDTTEPSFSNSIHNVDVVEAADGTRYIILAHSNGLGDEWYLFGDENAAEGSVTVLSCCDEPPRYFVDAYLAGSSPVLAYLRDVDLLEDGRLLVTDSGCVAGTETCTQLARVSGVTVPTFAEIEALDLPEVTGAWSPDHAQQNLTELYHSAALVPPIYEISQGVYEADFVIYDDLGSDLQSACQ